MHRRLSARAVFWALAATVVAADQVTKWLVLKATTGSPEYQLLPGIFFRLQPSGNTGLAWGLLRSWPHVVTILGIAVMAVVVYYFYRHAAESLAEAAVFGMILGGAIGNLADRVLFGQVRDFLDFRIFGYMWPTFNVADTCVSVGAVMLGLRILLAGKSKPAAK